MKKQFFLMGTAAIFCLAACNDSGTNTTTSTDSTATTQTNVERKGMPIANWESRTFVDLKTNKPIKLVWDTVHYYYVDESGNQPFYYYDPATQDTFDYWGRRLNSYLTYSNGDYILDESRMSSSSDTNVTVPDTATTTTSGDLKIKATDDKYKEKTDSTKLKVTDDKMKSKKK